MHGARDRERGVGSFKRGQPIELGADIGHAAGDHDPAGFVAGLPRIDRAHHTQRARGRRRPRAGAIGCDAQLGRMPT